MVGIDIIRFVDLNQDVAKYLFCSICSKIFGTPINSGCRHSFCRQCIEKWIDDNHKECPKCDKTFTKKRANAETNGDPILIGSYAFNVDVLASDLISEMRVKCSYDYNGCEEVIQFGSLATHHRECEHRICKECGFQAKPLSAHNCVEILKIHLNAWKGMYEKSQKTITEQNLIQSKRSLQLIEVSTLLMGTYDCSVRSLELYSDLIKMTDVAVNVKPCRYGSTKHLLQIPFNQIEEMKYCCDPSLPALIIRPNSISCRAIQGLMGLANGSSNGFRFDVNSNDNREKYLITVLNTEDTDYSVHYISLVLNNYKESISNANYQQIDKKTVQEILVARSHHINKCG